MSEAQTISERLRDHIADFFGVQHAVITPEAKIEDFGADSLDIIEFTLIVEEEFGIDCIADEEVEKWKTVADIEKFITEETSA